MGLVSVRRPRLGPGIIVRRMQGEELMCHPRSRPRWTPVTLLSAECERLMLVIPFVRTERHC